MITIEEVRSLMKSRGFTEMCNTTRNGEIISASFCNLSDLETRSPAVMVFVPSGDFEMNFNTKKGALRLSTGKCGPITHDKCFNDHYNWMQIGAAALSEVL